MLPIQYKLKLPKLNTRRFTGLRYTKVLLMVSAFNSWYVLKCKIFTVRQTFLNDSVLILIWINIEIINVNVHTWGVSNTDFYNKINN